MQQKTKRCEKLMTVCAKQSSEDQLTSDQKEISLLEFEIQPDVDKPEVDIPDVDKSEVDIPDVDKPEVGELAESFQVVVDQNVVLKQISSNKTPKRKWRKGDTEKRIPKPKNIKKENVSPIKTIQISKLGSQDVASVSSTGEAPSFAKYPVPENKTEILFEQFKKVFAIKNAEYTFSFLLGE